jgi:hypothetical protein
MALCIPAAVRLLLRLRDFCHGLACAFDAIITVRAWKLSGNWARGAW